MWTGLRSLSLRSLIMGIIIPASGSLKGFSETLCVEPSTECPAHHGLVGQRLIPGDSRTWGGSCKLGRDCRSAEHVGRTWQVRGQCCVRILDSQLELVKSYGTFCLAQQVWLWVTHGLYPTWLLCPRNSLSKNPGVVCHFLLQVIFTTWELNRSLLYWQEDSLHWARRESQWSPSVPLKERVTGVTRGAGTGSGPGNCGILSMLALKVFPGTSLVVQWLRLCLPMQGTSFSWSGS